MDALIAAYVDSSFLDSVVQLYPAVGAGVILGVIFAAVGWLFGLVINIVRFD